MNTSPTIDELEAASDAACAAHDKAVARRDALLAIVAALTALEETTTSSALVDADRAAFSEARAVVASPWLATLKSIRLANEEIDRLEMACHEAAHALNSAPEEAA